MAHSDDRVLLVVKPECFIVISLSLLLVPWRWVISWVIAIAVHEFFHFIAIRLCKCEVWQIDVALDGVSMKTQFDRPWTELVSTVAGPLGSICLGLFANIVPRIAVCGYMQFLFNLLPIYPNDGGRVLKVLFQRWMPSSMIVKALSLLNSCICGLILIGSIYMSIRYRLGLIPVLTALMISARIKKPCKERRMRVQ